jgi:hypothetical protein
LPEDIRPYGTPRNPHSRKELWKSQDHLQEIENMKDPKWYPRDTTKNIYSQPDYVKPRGDEKIDSL